MNDGEKMLDGKENVARKKRLKHAKSMNVHDSKAEKPGTERAKRLEDSDPIDHDHGDDGEACVGGEATVLPDACAGA